MPELMSPSLTGRPAGTKLGMRTFWGSKPRWHVYLIVKCNVGADVLQPNWYQDCRSEEISEIFCVFSNKSVVAHQPYWH